MSSTNKIYDRAEDLYVRKIIVYVGLGNQLYYDAASASAGTVSGMVTMTDLANYYKKGLLLIVDTDGMTKVPVHFEGPKTVYTVALTGFPHEVFSASQTYAIGNTVIYQGIAYVCKTAITVAAAWDYSKWDEIHTTDLFPSYGLDPLNPPIL